MNDIDWIDGQVHWFDELSGEGVVKDSDGVSYFVHELAIEPVNSPKDFKNKAKVKFQLIRDTTFVQVSKIKLAK